VVGGARPLWLSAAFIIEEGCEIALLRRIVASMAAEATRAGVRIVTGDTKVVERGKGDGVFITTAGIGVIPAGLDLGAGRIRPGDTVIVNGTLGDHGATILAARGDLALSVDLRSDCAGLGHLMQAALAAAPDIRAARDCTRGGLASALNELAEEAGLAVELDETRLPLRPEVAGMCELLGLDPLYLANEGRVVIFCPPEQAETLVTALRRLPEGEGARIIGKVRPASTGRVILRTALGGARLVDMLTGEQLPRIC
jgi:hydrogenase expression/formation protein HypE